MKENFFKAILGYFFAGFVVTFFWDNFITWFGLGGSWFAGLCLVGPAWYLNHYKKLIKSIPGAVFVDMGLAIAVTNITFSMLKQQNGLSISAFNKSVPTLLFLAIGAFIGAEVSYYLNKKMEKL